MKTKKNNLMSLGLIVTLFLISCTKTNDLSMYSLELSNNADSFQLQATQVKGLSKTYDYNWINNGTIAKIDKSGVLTGGSATLKIYDGNGTQVYTADLKNTGSELSSSGTQGTWKIHLELSNYSGDLNFRVQKGN